MTTETRPVPWWRTAPNPPCPPWCTETHKPGEFNDGGTLLCRQTIALARTYSVEVQQCTGTNATEDAYEADPPAVWQATDADEMSEVEAREFASALMRAAEMIRRSVTR